MTHATGRAALALAAGAAQQDAELVSLWKELLAAQAEADRRRDAYNAAAEAAQAEQAPHWRLHSVEHFPSRAVFVCAQRDMLKAVPLRSRDVASMQAEAERLAKRLDREHAASAAKAERRHSVRAKERAYTQAIDSVSGLVERIAETPAEGLTGAAIKLATALAFEGDTMEAPGHELVATAYRALTHVTGTDYAAQAQQWEESNAA